MRIKGYPAKCKCFYDEETAIIWGKYQEMISREKDAFNVRDQDMYTVLDVMTTKYGYDSREMNDCEFMFNECDIWHTYIGELDYDLLMKHAKKMLTTQIHRGGSKKNGTGIRKLPQPMTVLRKFAYLSAAINHMVKQGANLENHCLKVIAFIREIDKEVKSGKAITSCV